VISNRTNSPPSGAGVACWLGCHGSACTWPAISGRKRQHNSRRSFQKAKAFWSTGLLLAAADSCSLLPGNDPVDQVHLPPTLLTVDRHGNFGFGRRVFDSILENEKIGTEMGNRQAVAVDA
jgi:hypothetical protein